MKVLHITDSLDVDFGGPPRSITQLASAQVADGMSVSILTAQFKQRPMVVVDQRVKVHIIATGNLTWFHARTLGGFPEKLKAIAATERPDIVHIHTVWTRASHECIVTAAKLGLPIVSTPRGNMTRWAISHHKWKKRLAIAIYAWRDWQRVNTFHVTSKEEGEDLRCLGIKTPIALIPNGAIIPVPKRNNYSAHPLSEYIGEDFVGTRVALCLCRLSPQKGIDILLDAWARVHPKGWKLVLAGNNEHGYLEEINDKILALGLSNQVFYIGAIPDNKKSNLYYSVSLFIQASRMENFGMSIAEALAHALPVITTTATPWAELEHRGCGWWANPEVLSVSKAIAEATQLTQLQLAIMGQKGKQLMGERYSWLAIAQQTRQLYKWIVAGGDLTKLPSDVPFV